MHIMCMCLRARTAHSRTSPRARSTQLCLPVHLHAVARDSRASCRVSRFEAQAKEVVKPKFGLGFGKLAVPDYGAIAAAAAMSGLAMATGDAGMIDPLHPVQTAQVVIDSAGLSMPVQAGKPAPAIPDYSSIAAACVASAM